MYLHVYCRRAAAVSPGKRTLCGEPPGALTSSWRTAAGSRVLLPTSCVLQASLQCPLAPGAEQQLLRVCSSVSLVSSRDARLCRQQLRSRCCCV